MSISIVTTFDPDKYEQYGEKCLRSLDQNLKDRFAQVFVYYDGSPEDIEKFGRCLFVSFEEATGGAFKDFVNYASKKRSIENFHPVNSKEYEDGKEFLFDAVRFSYKWFALIEAYWEHRNSTHCLVWLDADTEVIDTIPEGWFECLMKGSMCSYLPRARPYTETGCLIFNTQHRDTEHFFKRMEDMYHRLELFSLDYWIDCWAFDAVRVEMEGTLGTEFYSLNSRTLTGHVWEHSPLVSKIVHNKGLRKL